jgi:hypothetical protein
MIFVGLAGYLLPIPSLIWAWVRWAKSKPRFVAPVWRSVVAFSGLILASGVGLFVVLVLFYANSLSEPAKYSFVVASSRGGFLASAVALVLSLVGKGRAGAPVALASFGLGSFWLITLAMY